MLIAHLHVHSIHKIKADSESHKIEQESFFIFLIQRPLGALSENNALYNRLYIHIWYDTTYFEITISGSISLKVFCFSSFTVRSPSIGIIYIIYK